MSEFAGIDDDVLLPVIRGGLSWRARYYSAEAVVAREGNSFAWRTAFGYKALLLRHPTLFHWCVYVEVPRSHPDFGTHPDRPGLRRMDEGFTAYGFAEDAARHGEITYSGPIERSELKRRGGMKRRTMKWVFGADFAHSQHFLPGYPDFNRAGTYVDKQDAILHGESMAEDLLERSSRPVPLAPLTLTHHPERARPWISLGRGIKARDVRALERLP
jgi:hypothetical protein